ncbi:alpha/beta hydrolase [Halocalculus aciditolerans]|uniref:Alpha/beta hydrolase n=1 Tax=Halocalculus aciditolerans TaxID=1383812 RepID=A0A830FQV0_9EURY|nr:alpha/beta fold hydrolase [Halocalculus aciditolerans]GGL72234.1 alpha/beta hydrolase [Halocalculus aciditolerans]
MTALAHTDVTASDGTRLRRWERAPADATEAVCFVHGATYGGRSAFAPDGFSWLDAVADAGRAAFAVDVRGYGDAERPPELDVPAADNGPVVRAPTAASDAADAFTAIRDTYDTLHLVGYSWGTITAGHALTADGFDADSLVQYAPVYSPPASRRDYYAPGEPPKAYRHVDRDTARDRWRAQRDAAVPDDAFDAFWATLDESGQRVRDETVVAPNGTLADLAASIDDPQYDPADIDVPTLVVRGSRDTASTRDDALALYDDLSTPDATYAELAGGTHFLQLEENRERLYDAVEAFHDRVS